MQGPGKVFPVNTFLVSTTRGLSRPCGIRFSNLWRRAMRARGWRGRRRALQNLAGIAAATSKRMKLLVELLRKKRSKGSGFYQRSEFKQAWLPTSIGATPVPSCSSNASLHFRDRAHIECSACTLHRRGPVTHPRASLFTLLACVLRAWK